jgi:hypothetical protein
VGLALLDATRFVLRPGTRAAARRTRAIRQALGSPGHVLGGPFAGMAFEPMSLTVQGGLLPKLVGSYEMEIWPALARLVAAEPDVVLNVGAGEGYYAVGLLRLLPRANLIAYEVDPTLRGATSALARANGVEPRITLAGTCTADRLRRDLVARPRPAVLCDCEGCEDVLLNPAVVPELGSAMILVEIHEALAPGVRNRVYDRLATSHVLTEFVSRARTRADAPQAGVLDDLSFHFATDEGRGTVMQWLWCEPRRTCPG